MEKKVPKNPTKYSGETLKNNDVKSDGKSFLPFENIDLMDKTYNRKSNIEKNWEACRVRCASTNGCKNFNYYKDKRCHLTSGTSVGFRKQAEMKWKTVRQPYTCYNCCYRRRGIFRRKQYYPCTKRRNVRKNLPTGKILNIETSKRGVGQEITFYNQILYI